MADKLAWGAKVSPDFRTRVRDIAARRMLEPNWIMMVSAFETGRTFRADIRNAAGSGAVGLFQFMPQTLGSWGMTVDQAAAMTPEQQLSLVDRYLIPYTGKLKTPGDVYLAVLWPAGIGRSDSAIIFQKGGARPQLYLQNRGLDLNHDNAITRGEITSKVLPLLAEGLRPANAA